MAYKDSLLVRTLSSRGNEFANIRVKLSSHEHFQIYSTLKVSFRNMK